MESEKSILGAILLENQSYWKIADTITTQHFTTPLHSEIFNAMQSMMDDKEPIDLVTLSAKVGHPSYLGELLDFVPAATTIKSYASLLDGEYRERQVDGMIYGASDCGTADEKIEFLESELSRFNAKGMSDNTTVKQEMSGLMKWVEDRYKNRGQLIGIPTSLAKLDDATLGLQPGDLTIIGARPSVGKTAFGLQLARVNGRGLFFSAEMGKRQLVLRLMSAMSGVSLQDIRSGHLTEKDFSSLFSHAKRLVATMMIMNDKSSPHINYIKTVARMEHMRNPLEYLIIDYIGLIQSPGENRRCQIGESSRQLKALAKDLHLPTVALAQLNRNTEGRTDPRPGLADLKESGDIEQDADNIILLHRPSRYCSECKEKKGDCGNHPKYKERGIDFYKTVDVILGKQRQGPLVDVKTYFEEELQQFNEIDVNNMPPVGTLGRLHSGG